MKEKFLSYLISAALAYVAAFTKSIDAVFWAISLAIVLVVADFLSGVAASFLVDHIGITSKKLRWSLVKTAVYAVAILSTLGIGVFLFLISNFVGQSSAQSILNGTMSCVQWEAYVIVWIEVVSILENGLRILPNNKFLKIIHFVVAVGLVKKIPMLIDALKEKDLKPEADETK